MTTTPDPDPKREHRYSLMINWSDTNDAYIVSIPELGVRTHGETLQEAVEMAKDLIACCVEEPPVINPLPKPLQFDDRTNFAPNPFVACPGLQEMVDETGKWSDETDWDANYQASLESERAKEPVGA